MDTKTRTAWSRLDRKQNSYSFFMLDMVINFAFSIGFI